MSQPSLRGRVVLKFPANVVAGHGIVITKEGGTYTFAVDESQLDLPVTPEGGIPEAPSDGTQYGRQGGSWTPIVHTGENGDDTVIGGSGDFVLKAGDTMTGPLNMSKVAGTPAYIEGQTGTSPRWRMVLGDGNPKSGSNAGSDFRLQCYSDTGTLLTVPMYIQRSTGAMALSAAPAANKPIVAINKLASGQAASVQGWTAGALRWQMALGDGDAEGGADSGSNFRLQAYGDAGSITAIPLYINRKTGSTLISGAPTPTSYILGINKLASGQASSIQGLTAGTVRWQMSLGDGDAEAGSSVGSNFRLQSYSDAGTLLTIPFYIERKTGKVTVSGAPVTGNPMLVLNKLANTQASAIMGSLNTSARWHISLGDGDSEGGSNSGSNFRIHRYDDAGAGIAPAMHISRATGTTTFYAAPSGTEPTLSLFSNTGQPAVIMGTKNNVPRWHMTLGDGGAESAGTNQGSDFRLHRYADDGSGLAPGLYITRQYGDLTIFGQPFKPGAGGWLDSSDARIKTELGAYTQGLSQVKALRPIRYKFKGNDVPPGRTQSSHGQAAAANTEFIGLIAQEAEVPMPEMVTKVPMDIDGLPVTDCRILDSSALIFALVNAVKELSARVEALEAAP